MAAPFQKNLSELHKIELLDGTSYKRWSQKLVLCFEQLKNDYVLTTEYADETDTSQNADADREISLLLLPQRCLPSRLMRLSGRNWKRSTNWLGAIY